MKSVSEMTTAELLNEYNTRTSKAVKKFSSRAAAERQVNSLRTIELFKSGAATSKAVASIAEKATRVVTAHKVEFAKRPKKVVVSGARSAAISDTWKDKKVAAARSLRSNVKVNGTEYKSVLKAFVALGLPVNKHIKFRGDLKAAGKAEFAGHKFVIVA